MDTKLIDSKAAKVRATALAQLERTTGITETPPKGWLTALEIAELTRTTPRNVCHITRKWIPKGLIRIVKFRANVGQFVRLTPHYAFHPKVAALYGLPTPKGERWAK
jgi:hypothetical protein